LNNNNRNNRRRGRGNRNQGGNPGQLNRIDSRARGNAPQMLDKYKKLAQDAHHNGDRVQMEYYLQFADHYFRVIADNKARQDEQRGAGGQGRRDEREPAEDYGDDDLDFVSGRRSEQASRPRYDQQDNDAPDDVTEGETGREGESFLSEVRDDDRGERQQRRPDGRRQQRKPRDDNRAERGERAARAPRGEDGEAARSEKPVRARRPRKSADDDRTGIDSSILPPSIRGDDAGGESGGALETVD
jgi:Domain of unknown function (DUF4167)